MAYPVIAAPYGLKPINLIGGQHFAGAVRHLQIQYGYPNNIYNGDFVKVAPFGSVGGAGLLTRASVLGAATKNQVTGVFLGVSYVSPATKQTLFANWWPAGLAAAGDAYVVDDPDTLFKVVALGAGNSIASFGWASVGSNMGMVNNPNGTPSGNSLNGANAGSESTAVLPVRVIDLVPETSIPVVMHGSSAALVITLTDVGGLTRALPVGTDVAYLAPNGQMIRTGAQVAAAVAVGATVVNVTTPPAANGVATPIPAGSTIIFTIYPEAIVKIDATIHGYTSDTAV